MLLASCGDDGGNGEVGASEPGRGDSAGSSTDEPADLEFCSLLDTSQIEAEFSEVDPVSDVEESQYESRCTWHLGEVDEGYGFGEMMLSDAGAIADDAAVAFSEHRQSDAQDSGFNDIADLGDEAYYSIIKGVVFRSGDFVLRLEASFPAHGFGEGGLQDKLETLARQIVETL